MKINRILISLLALCALVFGGCTKGGGDNGGSGSGGGNTTKPGAIEVAEGKNLVGYVLWDDGSPAEGVVVSDGFSCTKTGKDGIYQMTRHKDARHVMISFPQMAEITVKKNQVPDFFHPIKSSVNGVIRHDFSIVRRKGATPRRFQLIVIADSQIRLAKFGKHFSEDFCPDVNKTVAESNLPTIAITCGDDGDDNLWHQQRDNEDMTYQTVADCYGALSIPCFHCAGNHDHNRQHSVPAAANSKTTDYYPYYYESVKPFEAAFNPVDYSFNYGNVHFVVLDNIRYYAPSTFDYGFTDEQIEWLRQDLSYVPTSMAVVVSLHASYYKRSWVSNKQNFAKLLKPYANKILLIGHSHLNRYSVFDDPDGGKMTEWMLATPMGVFYRTDCNHTGEPAGYGMMTFSGTEVIDRYYKSAYYDRNYQGRLYDTSKFTEWKDAKDSDGVAWRDKVVGVVFDRTATNTGQKDEWTVELWENGEYSQVMTRYAGKDYAVYDMLYKTDFRSKYMSFDEHPNVTLYKAIPKSKTSVKSMRLVDWLGREFWVKDVTTSMDDLLTGMENGGK